MDKDKKEELKKLFSIIDEKKFLRFAKSYAGKDDAFADAIIEHFLPEDNYKKIIKIEDCKDFLRNITQKIVSLQRIRFKRQLLNFLQQN